MQPFIIVLIFFAVCLTYGIYRAIQDVREEAAQTLFVEQINKAISKMTGFSEAFLGMAKSTECANEAFKRFSIILGVDSPGGMVRDAKELHGYLSRGK